MKNKILAIGIIALLVGIVAIPANAVEIKKIDDRYNQIETINNKNIGFHILRISVAEHEGVSGPDFHCAIYVNNILVRNCFYIMPFPTSIRLVFSNNINVKFSSETGGDYSTDLDLSEEGLFVKIRGYSETGDIKIIY